MSGRPVIVDSNILFAALLARQSRLRERLLDPRELTLHAPHFLVIELFKHKERLCLGSELGADELLEVLHALLERITAVPAGSIPIGTWMEGYRLCREVDEKDTPFVALALHLGAPLWTGDEALKRGLRARGFDQFYEP